jgi:FtsH-binding integral membrane protein
MGFSTEVWDRSRGYDEISSNIYNLVFALTTAFGLLVYGGAAEMFWGAHLSIWGFIALVLVAIGGCFIAAIDFPPAKAFGLAMIAGGLGAISGPFFAHYKAATITDISAMTLMITLILGAFGTLYPKSLASWGGTLFSMLTALIIAQFLLPLIWGRAAHTLLDWIGVILFSGYIVFDFNRAQELPKNLDNAMDCGVAVFLDMINLLVRLVSLFGDSDD